MARPNVKITSHSCDRLLKIKFDNAIHICLKQDQVLGFKTYYKDSNKYYIKFYTTGLPVITSYSNRDHWLQVLNILDN